MGYTHRLFLPLVEWTHAHDNSHVVVASRHCGLEMRMTKEVWGSAKMGRVLRNEVDGTSVKKGRREGRRSRRRGRERTAS